LPPAPIAPQSVRLVIRAGPVGRPSPGRSPPPGLPRAPIASGVGGDPMVRPKELSKRGLERLFERCKEASADPVTATTFAEWLLRQRLDQPTKGGRPRVIPIREPVLVALYFLRSLHEPRPVEAVARDIWDLFEIIIYSPRQNNEETSTHIKKASAVAAHIRSGLKHCAPNLVVWIMLYLINESKQSWGSHGVGFESRSPGRLAELVWIKPRQPSVLIQWIDTWFAGFSGRHGGAKPFNPDDVLKLLKKELAAPQPPLVKILSK
jgi:hypothetical protein